MSTAEVVDVDGAQVIKLPDGIRLDARTVSVRREGESLILEPLKPVAWPDGFFEAIRIDDPKFTRPDQGVVPPVPSLG